MMLKEKASGLTGRMSNERLEANRKEKQSIEKRGWGEISL